MKIYYKVVSKHAKRYESVCLNSVIIGGNRENAIVYSVNKWVVPKIPNSGLFVFSKFQDASNFVKEQFSCLSDSDEIQIWECQVKNPRPFKVRASWNIQRFWEAYGKIRKQHKTLGKSNIWLPARTTNPEGTYLANAVKLIRLATQ